MEQLEVLGIKPELEELFCLPELPVVEEREDPQVFKLVVETTNYRIEIEIG